MPRTILTDEHWLKLKPILRDLNIYNKRNLRNVIEGILYRMKTGCQWRDIPECFGKNNSIFKCFNRWSKNDSFLKLFEMLSIPSDMEWVFIDASLIRAHQHSTGAQGTLPQAIAKSAGGNTSKIHLAVDANGNPVSFIITDGTTHDVKVAPDLVNSLDLSDTESLSADKAYDCEALREQISAAATKANIPRRKNSKSSNESMDWYLYKLRHLVENAFARLKHFRGIATRYDKLKQSYENMVALACAFIWLPL